jgi:hypothetical protein
MNNNNYFFPAGSVGYYNATNYATLAAWQSATGKDGASKNVQPSFVSATDLHLTTTGNTLLESGGLTVAGISTDFDGQTRPGPAGSVNGGGTAPDIGADEFDGVPAPPCTAPTAQPTALALTPASSTIAGSFTPASPTATNYLVVVAPTGTTPNNPTNGVNYSAGSNALGAGTIVVSNGTGTTFTATGLSPNTAYTVYVFANNTGACTGPAYLTTSPLTASTTTCSVAPTGVTIASPTPTSFTVNFTATAGVSSYAVQVSTSSTFAAGFDVTGSPFTTSGTSQVVTGLTPGVLYYVRVGSIGSGCIGYSTTVTGNTSVPNDECSTAVVLTTQPYMTPTSLCPSGVSGTTLGATASSLTAPVSTAWSTSADDDVFFEFTATNSSQVVRFCNVTYPIGITQPMGIVLTTGCLSTSTEIGNPNTVTITSGTGEALYTGLTVNQTYKLRVLTSGTTSRASFSISVMEAPVMTYVSSTTTQPSTATATVGSTNVQVVQAQVVVNGVINPQTVTALTFSTNGTTNPADITAARVYYTGTSSTFSTTTQFGTAVANPNGTFTVTGTQALTGGLANTTNYFWLVYDLSCTATPTNVVDAELTSLVVSGTTQTPTTGAPTGTRAITGLAVVQSDANSTTAVVGRYCQRHICSGEYYGLCYLPHYHHWPNI